MLEKELFNLVEEISLNLLQENINGIKIFKDKDNYHLFSEKIESIIEFQQYEIENHDEIIESVYNFMFGYGIIQSLIDDDEVSDINITRYDNIAFKKKGEYFKSEAKFKDENNFLTFCKLIILKNGGKLNEIHNYERVDDKKNKLRISVSIPPRSVLGPNICIRKHRKEGYSLKDLKNEGMLDGEILNLIERIVKNKKNIIICGKGSAGKTTLLRAILNEVPSSRRFLICESETELYPQNENFIVEKITKNKFGEVIELKDLVRDGLSMSLDGYCIGEIIGDEAWEFIEAGLTDHAIYATIHSSGIDETISRIKLMINHKIINLSNDEIDQMVYKSLDYILYISDFKLVSVGLVGKSGYKILYERR